MRLAKLEVVSLRPWFMWPDTTATASTVTPPTDSSTTLEMNMSLRASPGRGRPLAMASLSSTAPHISSASPASTRTMRSSRPPLFSTSMRRRLRTQFMSCTAELSSCFRSTASARRQSAVPAPRRHSLDMLVVEESSTMPPNPQATISATAAQKHSSDRRGCRNHHSSTCSSRTFRWISAGSAWLRAGGEKSSISGMFHAPRCRKGGRLAVRLPRASPGLMVPHSEPRSLVGSRGGLRGVPVSIPLH
uniref:Uncharacterized protein n=1 Tax=Paramormyrops kingsleyae TaxID=1676925 RepID=A0A3B3SMU4_9TELE